MDSLIIIEHLLVSSFLLEDVARQTVSQTCEKALVTRRFVPSRHTEREQGLKETSSHILPSEKYFNEEIKKYNNVATPRAINFRAATQDVLKSCDSAQLRRQGQLIVNWLATREISNKSFFPLQILFFLYY